MNPTPKVGDTVLVQWGLAEVRGRVAEIYGPPGRPYVVVELTPELSGEIVDESTTVSVPMEAVRLASVAA
jgi:hypothetical protein